MSRRNYSLGTIAILLGLVWLYLENNSNNPSRPPKANPSESQISQRHEAQPIVAGQRPKVPAPLGGSMRVSKNSNSQNGDNQKVLSANQELRISTATPKERLIRRERAVWFRIVDGLAVINGDIVLGKPLQDGTPVDGFAELPELRTWKHREIPFLIQPNVKNPERVEAALAMFANTAVIFVPYTNQPDVLVFEDGQGVCKSYVGRVGGFQPVWIPQGCGAPEIAHELMHALGFIHEQNRADRDSFVELLKENIDPKFVENFEILPQQMMKLSGLAPFDFESLMIYQPKMFSVGDKLTMRSKILNVDINQGHELSAKDIERINAAFAALPLQP